jgi:signal transduction histidine kinase
VPVRGLRRGARGGRQGEPGGAREWVCPERGPRQRAGSAARVSWLRLAKAARQSAVLEERNQLAAEVHGALAQSFTGISVQLGVAGEQVKASDCVTCAKEPRKTTEN